MAASQRPFEHPRLIVLMGVAGCGKSTVGPLLAAALGSRYLDGDTFHPPENIRKMAAGTPLEDKDRWPWLDRIAETLEKEHGPLIVGCSALKRRYRQHIRTASGRPVFFVHLSGPRDLIAKRMLKRDGHFMPTSLLESQIAALEPPRADEAALEVSIDQSMESLVGEIVKRLVGGGT